MPGELPVHAESPLRPIAKPAAGFFGQLAPGRRVTGDWRDLVAWAFLQWAGEAR
jgi:hypothetical protein